MTPPSLPVRLGVLVAVLQIAGACTSVLTPRQEITWDAYKACEGTPSETRLVRLAPDGGWVSQSTIPSQAPALRLNDCMLKYWQEARRKGEVPAREPSLDVSRPSAARASASLVVSEAPVWAKGDEWEFSSEGPSGKSTFVWTVDREESIDEVPHYVIRTGTREIFYRKTDLAFTRETVDRVVVSRSVPSRIRYVWPLSVGTTWEQTFRSERPVDRQTNDRIDVARVVGEETITVPAGTFKTLKIVYRYKSTGGVNYAEWYSPDVKMLIRTEERLESGSRVRELLVYRRQDVGLDVKPR